MVNAAPLQSSIRFLPWFFVASVGLLAYGHYETWVRGRGSPGVRWVLLVNTSVVAYLWSGRVTLWLEGLLN